MAGSANLHMHALTVEQKANTVDYDVHSHQDQCRIKGSPSKRHQSRLGLTALMKHTCTGQLVPDNVVFL